MNNSFTEETRELFFWNNECWYCGKNHIDCLHHILGRISDSPLNAAPLNNFECHIGNGCISTYDMKCKFLKKTLEYLLSKDYKLTKKDKEFKKKYFKYYN
jgi:hypothetical protein